MKVEVAFGKTGLDLELPEGIRYKMLEAKSATPLADPAAEYEKALDAPIASPPLLELAKGKKTVAISVCDITRPVPNPFLLPPILKRLEQAGVPRDGITICIATGLHRAATQEEIDVIVGTEIASTYRIHNHDARDLAAHRSLGKTSTGTPVFIDEKFVGADLHITLGFIEPHLMLGYSGGRKLIAPGLAYQDTIKVLHSPKFMRDARSVEGSIEDNPLHRELLEIASMAGHHFMVDVSLTRKREIAGIFAGNNVEAHRAGVRFVSKVMLELLDEPADVVITTSAGYPLDLTYYQAIKGATAAQHIVKPGGRILLSAACEEGPGAQEFCDMVKGFPDAGKFMDKLAHSDVVIDQWQLEKLGLVAQKADLHFYMPGLKGEYYPSLWGQAHDTPEAAIAAVTEGLGPDSLVAVIPEGPYVLAKPREAETVAG